MFKMIVSRSSSLASVSATRAGACVLYGDPSGRELWEELDALLRERVPHESGRQVRIRAACIDSGGHHTVAVYNFVRDKQAHGIWACKGASRPSMPPRPRRPVRVGKNRVTPL
jgi:phage terminase large subunit GpA-like protein